MQPQLQNNQHPQMNMGQQQAAMTGMPNTMQQQQMQQQMQQRFMQQQMQQQQQQQQQQHPNQVQGMPMPTQAQMPMGNPQVRMQGMPPNMPHPVQQPTQQPLQQSANQQVSLTPAELQQVPALAHRLITNYPKDQLGNLQNQLQQDNPNIPINNLLQKYFSAIATQRVVSLKRQQMLQMIPGPNSGPVPPQNRPVPQVSGPPPNQQPTPISAPQTFDPSFMGNFEQLRQDAIRSQERGQVVVPASQGVPQQQRPPGGGTPAVAQNGANRAAQTPQIPQQPQQPRNQQNGQTPQQPNVFPSGMNSVPQNVFQGQNGGLNKEARTPQQNTNMPTLNRAFGPQPNMQPQQNPGQTAQQNVQNPQQLMQNGGPRASMTQIQQAMQRMTEPERKAFMMRMQAQRQQNAGVGPVLQQKAQQGQPIPVGPQSVQNPQPTNRSGQPSAQPQQPVNGQTLPQPQQRNQLQRKAAQAANNSLTTEQEQQMDGYPYPPGILAAGNALSQLPESVKTWGQLKNWVKANAGNVPPGSEQKLRGLQGLHYMSLQPKKSVAPQGVRNAAPPAPMMPGPNQPSNLPQIPQTTTQEISSARQRYPQLAGKSDEEINNLIMGQRAKQLDQQRSQFTQQQVQQQVQMQIQQALIPQNQIQQPQVMQQQKPPQPLQRTQPQQMPKSGAQSKPQPAPTSQAPAQTSTIQKGVKRISSDDVVEVPNPNLNQQRSQAKPQPKAPAANMGQIPPKPVDAPKVQAVQRDTPNPQAAPPPAQSLHMSAEAIKSDEKYKEIVSEVRQVLPQRQPVPMDPDTRTKMIQKIVENKRLLERMGPFMTSFWRVFHDEKGLRNLAQLVG